MGAMYCSCGDTKADGTRCEHLLHLTEEESQKDKRIRIVMKLPSKNASAKNSFNAGENETSHQVEHTVQSTVSPGAGLASYRRGQRSRQGRNHSSGVSGRSQERILSLRTNSRKRSITSSSMKMGKLLVRKGRPWGHGHFRGHRSIRIRQKSAVKVDVITGESETIKDIVEDVAGVFVRDDINGNEIEAATKNASISKRSGYEDDIYQATGDGHDYLDGFSGKSENFTEGSHCNVGNEDRVGDNDGHDDDVGQVDLNWGVDADTKENAEQNMDPDGVDSTSSLLYSH